ncbi:hypothetical protein H6P81_009104 [Aristolochia fimbriata]|uniref:Uncharacterized protein n=1 Tax=Aristolochia fimbriata TaxID=158543 RepID=A0AAV7ELB2_ARIFI|nr:hypothetical protein H6P81_009104 [Aristolochia fimbriata]
MAPNGDTTVLVSSGARESSSFCKPRKLSMEGLQRAMSDLSLELSKEGMLGKEGTDEVKLPPISEVEEAKCECCGMSEECTPEYIHRVRDKFCGKWICGLCSEAVKEESEKGGPKEEALKAHMSACARFNRIGRAYPVLMTADAMREILKKSTNRGGVRGKSISPRELGPAGSKTKPGAIARSSSCIPAITKEMTEFAKQR